MKRKALVVGWIAIGLAGPTGAEDSAGVTSPVHRTGHPVPRAAAFTTASASSINALALPDFASVVARCAPAVVTISITESEQPSAMGRDVPQPGVDSAGAGLLRRSELLSPSDDRAVPGIGSGFIVSADGAILTTAHLVNGARRIDVRLADDRELEAKLIGVDTRSDVAVLKVDAGTHLPTAKLGNSTDTRVGDWVVAIGSPFGLEGSVSRGIVSAKSRALPGRTYVPFIQTDVSVNPGDSGGPLINMKGEVIGINSHIVSLGGGYEGLSFAIPIEIASYVATQLLLHGKVTRGKLGVSAQEMTQGLADSFGLDRMDGVLVSAVEPGGPAAKAGLEPGDVILALDDEEVTSSIDLPARVAAIKPGTSIRLMVFHRGYTKAVNVTVGKLRDASAESGRK